MFSALADDPLSSPTVLRASIEAGKEVDPFVKIKYMRDDCVFLKAQTKVIDAKTTPYWNHLVELFVFLSSAL